MPRGGRRRFDIVSRCSGRRFYVRPLEILISCGWWLLHSRWLGLWLLRGFYCEKIVQDLLLVLWGLGRFSTFRRWFRVTRRWFDIMP
jgi:hypothetical protein